MLPMIHANLVNNNTTTTTVRPVSTEMSREVFLSSQP